MNKSISLVIVETDAYHLARRAVERTINLFHVDEVLIFSDQPSQWEGYSVFQIDKIRSLTDFNRIIFSELPHQLKTDFALLIQFDGFVINPSSFTDFFYNFDYIGAPWPSGMLPGHGALVGNGGFSLRSRRLIEILSKYQQFVNFEHAEDVTICRFLRPMLEECEGICFAPVEVARHFSSEFEIVKNISPFGFHGLQTLPKVYSDDYKFLIDHLPDRCLQKNSYQLYNLQQGFMHLNSEAQSLFNHRVQELDLRICNP
jgi:hypothetical protein